MKIKMMRKYRTTQFIFVIDLKPVTKHVCDRSHANTICMRLVSLTISPLYTSLMFATQAEHLAACSPAVWLGDKARSGKNTADVNLTRFCPWTHSGLTLLMMTLLYLAKMKIYTVPLYHKTLSCEALVYILCSCPWRIHLKIITRGRRW